MLNCSPPFFVFTAGIISSSTRTSTAHADGLHQQNLDTLRRWSARTSPPMAGRTRSTMATGDMLTDTSTPTSPMVCAKVCTSSSPMTSTSNVTNSTRRARLHLPCWLTAGDGLTPSTAGRWQGAGQNLDTPDRWRWSPPRLTDELTDTRANTLDTPRTSSPPHVCKPMTSTSPRSPRRWPHVIHADGLPFLNDGQVLRIIEGTHQQQGTRPPDALPANGNDCHLHGIRCHGLHLHR